MPRPKTGSSNPNPNPRVPILRLDPKMPLPMMNLPLLRFHGNHPRMPLCSTPLPELIDGRNFGKGVFAQADWLIWSPNTSSLLLLQFGCYWVGWRLQDFIFCQRVWNHFRCRQNCRFVPYSHRWYASKYIFQSQRRCRQKWWMLRMRFMRPLLVSQIIRGL